MYICVARYDTTVRNARGCVMQFLYGEDGMDAQRIEKQFFDTYKYKIADFREVGSIAYPVDDSPSCTFPPQAYYFDLSSEYLGQMKYFVAKTGEPAYYLHPSVVAQCREVPCIHIFVLNLRTCNMLIFYIYICSKDSELRAMLDDEYDRLLRDRQVLREVMACRGVNLFF